MSQMHTPTPQYMPEAKMRNQNSPTQSVEQSKKELAGEPKLSATDLKFYYGLIPGFARNLVASL